MRYDGHLNLSSTYKEDFLSFLLNDVDQLERSFTQVGRHCLNFGVYLGDVEDMNIRFRNFNGFQIGFDGFP